MVKDRRLFHAGYERRLARALVRREMLIGAVQGRAARTLDLDKLNYAASCSMY
jgi:hypothetical protein